jgi:hypothetical protein
MVHQKPQQRVENAKKKIVFDTTIYDRQATKILKDYEQAVEDEKGPKKVKKVEKFEVKTPRVDPKKGHGVFRNSDREHHF